MKDKNHGFTLFITVGRWGGVYVRAYKTGTLRLCLGFIAVTVCFYDAEKAISDKINKQLKIEQ